MERSEESTTIVVCDAGPLIHLDEVRCLDLLSDFSKVLVPDVVWNEVRIYRPAITALPDWITVTATAQADAEIEALASLFTLHRGELAALTVARMWTGAWLLTDDTAARLAAKTLHLEAHGTIGIILRAIRRGLRSRERGMFKSWG